MGVFALIILVWVDIMGKNLCYLEVVNSLWLVMDECWVCVNRFCVLLRLRAEQNARVRLISWSKLIYNLTYSL